MNWLHQALGLMLFRAACYQLRGTIPILADAWDQHRHHLARTYAHQRAAGWTYNETSRGYAAAYADAAGWTLKQHPPYHAGGTTRREHP